jgi:hypothetical protein
MHPLSADALCILARLESDLLYEPQDLRALVPDISLERLGELMHELWVNREVERVGYCGWRRHRSTSPCRPEPVRDARHVRPEDLFDHAAFAEFFK